MKSHGCLMSDPMMRAVLSEEKTVTRRLSATWAKVQPGDELWFREVWASGDRWMSDHECDPPAYIWYRADGVMLSSGGTRMDDEMMRRPTKWRSSMLMPRSVCRAFGTVVSVREERLQDITEEDCRREGMHTVKAEDLLEFGASKREIVNAARLYGEVQRGSRREIDGAWQVIAEAWPTVSALHRFQVVINAINGPGTWDRNQMVYRVEWAKKETECKM